MNKIEFVFTSTSNQSHLCEQTPKLCSIFIQEKTFYNNYELHNSRNKVELFLRPITFINDSSLQFQNTLFQILGHNPVLYKKSVP